MEAWRQYQAFGRLPDLRPEKIDSSSADRGRSPIPPIQNVEPDSARSASSQSTVVEQDSGESQTTPRYVSFEEGDNANPHNWSILYKAWIIAILSFLTLSLTFASSVSAATENAVMEELGCSQIAATATTGVFLVGMGLGAMPAAPLSELYGRLPVYGITLIIATIFEIATALSPNIAALIVLRFFAGFFSAAPLSNAGGSLNDIGGNVVRTITLPLFATTGFVGSTPSVPGGRVMIAGNLTYDGTPKALTL